MFFFHVLIPQRDDAQSCLTRERAFEYAAKALGARVCIMRLNYAIDLRYGVLHDIAQTILAEKAVDLAAMPSFNCIWQKDANEIAIRLLLHTSGQAQWLLSGGCSLGKPTHFEERNGNY